jgi:His-Xaa-Ser system protein HxsD
MKSIISLDNLEIEKSKNLVTVAINPKVFPLPIVYSAAYIMIDKAYVVLDGDPEQQLIVRLRAKEKEADLEGLGRQLNDELLNYASYMVQTAKNKEIRDAIVQRAFLTQSQAVVERSSGFVKEPSYKDDPLGIRVPFEKRKKSKKKR